jgi:hypothetical protein
MRRPRYVVANTVILFIVAASVFDIVRDEEHWPFSQYPMFNRVTNSRDLSWLRLYGVTADGQEYPLLHYADVFPFDQSRLSKVLGSIRARPDGGRGLQTALRNCLERYERRRKAEQHSGPPLTSLRLYQVHWRLDDRAANVHTPDARALIAEVSE